MDYILNPWWIYLIKQADGVHGGLSIIGTLSVILVIASFIVKFYYTNYEDISYGYASEETQKAVITTCKKIMRISIPLCIVSSVGAIIIPSSETLIYMLVAKMATYSNINFTVDKFKEIADYIIQAISKIK